MYILENAVAAYTGRVHESRSNAPVPPCIGSVEPDGCQIALEVEDKATKPDIVKISADSVRIAIVTSVSHDHANEEILEFMGKVYSGSLCHGIGTEMKQGKREGRT